MGEIILGMIGAIIAAALFFTGVFVGAMSSSKKLKGWIDENGCYACQEKWRYRNRLTDEGE